MNNFSPNMLKTFEECRKKFFYRYVERLSPPQRSAFFEKGKKVHALANYYLSGADISKMESVLKEDEKKAWETLKNNKFFNLKPVKTEYNLSCKVGEHWIGGRLDALMKGEDEGQNADYFILDYKTGSIPKNPEYDYQTMVYLLAADKFLRLKGGYASLSFVYVDLKNKTEHEIDFNPKLAKQYEEKIIYTCDGINLAVDSKVFLKGKNCEKCEFKKLCED